MSMTDYKCHEWRGGRLGWMIDTVSAPGQATAEAFCTSRGFCPACGVKLNPDGTETRMVEAVVSDANNDLRETFASLAHGSWTGWMKYLYSRGSRHEGALILPAEWVERWQRQMKTAYADLSEEEKDADRAEADKYLAALQQAGEVEKLQATLERVRGLAGKLRAYSDADSGEGGMIAGQCADDLEAALAETTAAPQECDGNCECDGGCIYAEEEATDENALTPETLDALREAAAGVDATRGAYKEAVDAHYNMPAAAPQEEKLDAYARLREAERETIRAEQEFHALATPEVVEQLAGALERPAMTNLLIELPVGKTGRTMAVAADSVGAVKRSNASADAATHSWVVLKGKYSEDIAEPLEFYVQLPYEEVLRRLEVAGCRILRYKSEATRRPSRTREVGRVSDNTVACEPVAKNLKVYHGRAVTLVIGGYMAKLPEGACGYVAVFATPEAAIAHDKTSQNSQPALNPTRPEEEASPCPK